MNQSRVIGFSMLAVGLGLMVSIDPSFLGIVFVIIGVVQLGTSFQSGRSE